MVIKLAIVDDRVQVRNTIQSRIEYTNEIKTIFTAINGQDFFRTGKKTSIQM
jgi:hypothetical protein